MKLANLFKPANNVQVTVNVELTLLYWHIGQRINQHILNNERAEYKEVVKNLSKRSNGAIWEGWGKRHLSYLMQFAAAFPDPKIVHTLCAQLSWSHFKLIIAAG